MSIEHLYQQAQVLMDATSKGRELRVNSEGDLQVAGFAHKSLVSLRNLVSTPDARHSLKVQRHRQIVKTLIQAVEEVSRTSPSDSQIRHARAIELLNDAYEKGEIPAARTFIAMLGLDQP